MHSLAGIKALNDRAVEKELDDRRDDLALKVNKIRPFADGIFKVPVFSDKRNLSLWGTLREVEDYIQAKREVSALCRANIRRFRQAKRLFDALFGRGLT